jgi:hypothetical protein
MSGSSDHEQKIRERAADRHDEFWHQAREQIPHPPEPLNSNTVDNFPASDPPSSSGVAGPKAKSGKTVAAGRKSGS